MFQVSQYVGGIGIVVAAALVVMKASEGKISRIAMGMMTVSRAGRDLFAVVRHSYLQEPLVLKTYEQ